jgi:hypothetical protein
MIDYQTFEQIRLYADQQGLKVAQIARLLNLDERTVAHWIGQKTYHPSKRAKRASKLDPFKGQIVRLLESYPYSAQQILQRIRAEGYDGGYSILKNFVRAVRPVPRPAFLTLDFAPRPMRPSRLGQRRGDRGGIDPATGEFFCHGVGLQPSPLCGVHPGANAGTLAGLPSTGLGILWWVHDSSLSR